jgi:hypothetical protein
VGRRSIPLLKRVKIVGMLGKKLKERRRSMAIKTKVNGRKVESLMVGSHTSSAGIPEGNWERIFGNQGCEYRDSEGRCPTCCDINPCPEATPNEDDPREDR